MPVYAGIDLVRKTITTLRKNTVKLPLENPTRSAAILSCVI